MKTTLKILFALACFLAATAISSIADASNRVTVNIGPGPATSGYSGGYTTRYGYSSTFPQYRTFRTYRSYRAAPVITYSTPATGYYVPAPAQAQVAPAPVAAPADPAPVQDPPVVMQQYAVPMRSYSVQSYASPSYFAADDDAVASKVKHKEKHKHGKHRISHKETSR